MFHCVNVSSAYPRVIFCRTKAPPLSTLVGEQNGGTTFKIMQNIVVVNVIHGEIFCYSSFGARVFVAHMHVPVDIQSLNMNRFSPPICTRVTQYLSRSSSPFAPLLLTRPFGHPRRKRKLSSVVLDDGIKEGILVGSFVFGSKL